MTRSVVVAALLLVVGAAAGAQSANAPDPLLNHLVGKWVLRGAMAGKSTVHDVTCQWVLGKEYVQVHEVSREKTASGSPAYEAIVYIGRDSTGEYAALWLDNTAYGAFAPAGTGHAKAAGDSIPFVFGNTPAERFHNTFIYDRARDTWQWHLDNDSAGVRKPFARVTLTRP